MGRMVWENKKNKKTAEGMGEEGEQSEVGRYKGGGQNQKVEEGGDGWKKKEKEKSGQDKKEKVNINRKKKVPAQQ